MRYKAFRFTETESSSGHSRRQLSTDFLRCDLSVKRANEWDDETLGIYATTTYRIRFWKRSADAASIRAGSHIQINGQLFRIINTQPSGIGLKQYLDCEAQVAEDS